MKKVYVNYDQVHRDTRNLYEQIEPISPNGVILIAVARGGWITSRILAASYEENGIENHSYSIDATYINHGTANEYVSLTQSLDERAVNSIKALITKDLPIVVVDSVCQTGRELAAVTTYLKNTFPKANIYIAVMNWVKYEQSPRTPWRSAILIPDFYGLAIESDEMPYVEYPWEYSSLDQFNKSKESK